MIEQHLNKDGSPDMRWADNRYFVKRSWNRSLFLAGMLGFLVACIGMAFIMRPKTASQPVFDPVEIKEGYINDNYPENFYEHVVVPTSTPKPKAVVKVAYAKEYTYENHANKPYYRQIIAGLQDRYVSWWDAAELIGKESGFNPFAVNPTSSACGLGQSCPCSKMGCELSDIDCQLDWQKEYIANRYGTVSKALAYWYQKGWY